MEEAKSAKEKEMKEVILVVEISKVLADFKVGDMATEVQKVVGEGVKRFRVKELLTLL